MAKRRGNPNWGKPEPIGSITPTITEFEQVVREYKLSPDQYLRSTRLREWAGRNKNSKYIPEPLLEEGVGIRDRIHPGPQTGTIILRVAHAATLCFCLRNRSKRYIRGSALRPHHSEYPSE